MDKVPDDFDGGIGGGMHQPKKDFNDKSLTSVQKHARLLVDQYHSMYEEGSRSVNPHLAIAGSVGASLADMAVKLADENARQQKQIADMTERLEKLEQSQKQAKPVNKGPVNPPRHR